MSSGLLIPLPDVKEVKDSPRQRSGSRVFKTGPSPITLTQPVGSTSMTGTSTPESTTPTSKSTRRSFWDILVSSSRGGRLSSWNSALCSLITGYISIYYNSDSHVIGNTAYNWVKWILNVIFLNLLTEISKLKPPTYWYYSVFSKHFWSPLSGYH